MPSRHSLASRIAWLAAAAASIAYAQTLNLRPGLYEFTSIADVQLPPDVAARMPPQALARMQQPHVSQHCITQTDLDHVSRQLSQGRGGDEASSCKVTEHSIVGNQVTFTSQCPRGTAHFEGSFAADSFQGTMVSSGEQGRNVTVKISAKRVGDCSQ
jgi:Protein of unknown function (DUF3617)